MNELGTYVYIEIKERRWMRFERSRVRSRGRGRCVITVTGREEVHFMEGRFEVKRMDRRRIRRRRVHLTKLRWKGNVFTRERVKNNWVILRDEEATNWI